MKITMRYTAHLKQAAGTSTEEIELAESGSVHDLLRALTTHHADLKRLLFDAQGEMQATILVFVGDDQVDDPKGTTLNEGDSVTLLSPIAGGSYPVRGWIFHG